MFSEKDFEIYKAEGKAKGVSINSFCISNNIPYTAFYDWFKKTQKKEEDSTRRCRGYSGTEHMSKILNYLKSF